jgi:hypothetical protein
MGSLKSHEIALQPAMALVGRYRAYILRTGMSHRRFGNFAKVNSNWHNEVEREGGMSSYRFHQIAATMERFPDGVKEDRVPVKSLTQEEIQRRRDLNAKRRADQVQYWLDRENAPVNYFGDRTTPIERMIA